jgi:hypothetical protein
VTLPARFMQIVLVSSSTRPSKTPRMTTRTSSSYLHRVVLLQGEITKFSKKVYYSPRAAPEIRSRRCSPRTCARYCLGVAPGLSGVTLATKRIRAFAQAISIWRRGPTGVTFSCQQHNVPGGRTTATPGTQQRCDCCAILRSASVVNDLIRPLARRANSESRWHA